MSADQTIGNGSAFGASSSTARVMKRIHPLLLVVLVLASYGSTSVIAADGSKFYHSDGDARFLHHIHLYDANNRKIGPDSTTPYSTEKTCGRCHDYETISHGWHFNAVLEDSVEGRQAEPWIWTDPRTGTQLPLSYRSWNQTHQPRDLGITAWEMTKQFGGRIPGGGVGQKSDEEMPSETVSRWPLSGTLEIDCLACHSVSGKYDFNARREQIEEENFAWAATAALRIATIKGSVSRLKEGADPASEETKAKLPQMTYDAGAFASDGTVFMDLIRKPENNACYQCHSHRTVSEEGIDARWVHDQDVHLRSGMQCVDCHRNGIDHHIVRGFDGEVHPSGQSMTTLSCSGCHLGTATELAGRLGSPKPEHAGLPPVSLRKALLHRLPWRSVAARTSGGHADFARPFARRKRSSHWGGTPETCRARVHQKRGWQNLSAPSDLARVLGCAGQQSGQTAQSESSL